MQAAACFVFGVCRECVKTNNFIILHVQNEHEKHQTFFLFKTKIKSDLWILLRLYRSFDSVNLHCDPWLEKRNNTIIIKTEFSYNTARY